MATEREKMLAGELYDANDPVAAHSVRRSPLDRHPRTQETKEPRPRAARPYLDMG